MLTPPMMRRAIATAARELESADTEVCEALALFMWGCSQLKAAHARHAVMRAKLIGLLDVVVDLQEVQCDRS